MIDQIKNAEKIIDSIKDKLGNIIYESWRILSMFGVPPLILPKCKGENLIDYQIEGNSVQDGTPTPETPIEIESVGIASKNILNPNINNTVYSSGYRFTYLELPPQPLAISIIDKDTSVDLTGTSFGFTGSGTNASGGYNWLVSNGRVLKNTTTNTVTLDDKPANDAYMFFSVYPATEETWNKIFERFYIQIEKGTTATEYEPYGYSIPVKVNGVKTNILLNEPLRKIGDNVDYIDFKNKKVVRVIKKLFFNGCGTEKWTLQTESTRAFYCNGIDSGYGGGNAEDNLCLCNRFIHNSQSNLFSGIAGIAFRGENYKRMYITFGKDSEINTLDLLKKWLANNPLEAVFLSLNPTEEEEIELPDITTYKGMTKIEIDTKTQPSNMEVVYKGKPVIISELTEEEIEAINNMSISNDENGLSIAYADDVLDIDFNIQDSELIITNYTNANFSINENGEMEVDY